MKNVVDNQVIKRIAEIPSALPISLRWPTFLECLDLGSLFTDLPCFNQEHPFFQKCLKILHEEGKDQAIGLFDRLFTENLCLVKELPQIQVSFLLGAIERKRKSIDERLSLALSLYEERFWENAPFALHDLILYLGFELMCISVSRLFDVQAGDVNFLQNLERVKECLIESYQHIAKDGKTSPSLYRLLEALFFYHMREENLQKHTDEEWTILSQSFPLLKNQETLADVFYIDDTFQSEEVTYLTWESQASVNVRLAFADCLIKKELPNLTIDLKSKSIVSLN